ncbi:TonB-dependent receptor [Sphingobacterium spiritivorum ATCC 33300]|uniref:TonB-dependent receptor n=1 Tax=Sphingobacterium spiritivorum ATCC 33300 TaxID=525372 RepID=C2G0B2_SPHSI|nr:TonB-dependent receptor [Sphingobacterium spiritivorum]EEI91292.1 TonB-dependent receptor [Sphingobacterium spiritivorum ATCC 33300]QQS97400.1 TonB-dependent receptor [Sphingobacterium spiritivorum]
MIKSLIIVLWLCALTTITVAQQTLTVKVQDKLKSTALQDATVTLTGRTKQTLTSNSTGIVQFTNLQSDDYLLKVSYIGYNTVQQTVRAGQQTQITIEIEPRSIHTEEVLVQATRARNNSATTYKNLSKEDIAKNNLGQDIPYLLDQTPSVVVGSDAGAGIGYTNMTIRGSDNQRINVTLNGIPLNDAESMGSFFVNLPDFASSVENIQIQRGIGTSTNGAGSFGASLNIQSNTLEENPYVELNNSFGSYNSWKNTLKIGSGLINNKFAFNARLSRILSDGYIERASSDLKSFYIDGGYYSKKHIIKAIVFSGKEKTYQAWYGTPEPLIKGDRAALGDYATAMELSKPEDINRLLQADRRYNIYTYDNQTDNYTQTHHQLHYTYFINDQLTLNTALHYTRGAGYYEEFKENDKLAKYGLPDITIGNTTYKKTDLIRRRWLDNYFYGATYSLNYNPSNDLKFTLGGAYNQYKGDHYGQVMWARYDTVSTPGYKYYAGDAQKNDLSVFLKTDYQIGNWLLMADVQYRNIDYKIRGNDDKIKNMDFHSTFNFVNPKVGFTYLINSTSNVYASYAYGSKEPVRKDFVENTSGTDPKPEKMQDVEFGYRLRNEYFNIGINGYGMFYKDQLIPTGAINDVGSAIRQNVPDSYRIGLEFDGAWRISDQFTWKATAGLSQNKIKNFVEYLGAETIQYNKTNIALSPSAILSNELAYSPITPLTFALASKYVSRQYLDNSSAKERSIDAFFVNNLRTYYTFSMWGIQKIDLSLSINNIFNEKYETSGYTWGYLDDNKDRLYYNFYTPQATTNFMLGLNVRF